MPILCVLVHAPRARFQVRDGRHLKSDARSRGGAPRPGSREAAVNCAQRELKTPFLSDRDNARQQTSGASPRISFERLDRFDSFEHLGRWRLTNRSTRCRLRASIVFVALGLAACSEALRACLRALDVRDARTHVFLRSVRSPDRPSSQPLENQGSVPARFGVSWAGARFVLQGRFVQGAVCRLQRGAMTCHEPVNSPGRSG